MWASDKLLRGLLIGGAGSDSGAKPAEPIHRSAWKVNSPKFDHLARRHRYTLESGAYRLKFYKRVEFLRELLLPKRNRYSREGGN